MDAAANHFAHEAAGSKNYTSDGAYVLFEGVVRNHHEGKAVESIFYDAYRPMAEKEMALVIEAQSLAERDVPDYVVPDGNTKVTYTRVPKLDEVPYPVRMEPNLVIEFYSR